MTFDEAMEYMDELGKLGSVLGLDTMRELMDRLDNPQEKLRIIHIAGTNGKGSVVAYISTVLKANGYKVGRYVSPTIFSYCERFQIGGKQISQKKFCDCLEHIKQIVDEMIADGLTSPTAFEVETAIAFYYFAMEACDYVVLETGMGGDLDATNVVEHKLAAVIASVSMDHMNFLGKTLQEIAEKKAGIIKNGCYVYTMEQDEQVLKVLENTCKEQNSSYTVVSMKDAGSVRYGMTSQSFSYKEWKNMKIHLAGKFQVDNAVLALGVLDGLYKAGAISLTEKAVRKGFEETKWPARFEVIGKNPLFVVDGAHNEDAARRLRENVEFYFTNKRIIYIMGVLRDKEYDKIIREMIPYASEVITVTSPNRARALPAYELAKEIAPYHERVTAVDSIEEAVEISYLFADKESVILAFGSLSYLGDLIRAVEKRQKIKKTHK